MEIQLQLTNHKQINEMITKFEKDKLVHFRQAHRMIDLFETIIKTNTAILLANYFDVNKISDEVAKKLVQGMRTPSLGTWLGFNEVVFEQLAFNNIPQDVFETIYHSVQQHDREKIDRIYKKEKNTYVFRPKEERGRIKGKGQFFERLFSNYYRNHNANGKPFTNLLLPSFYMDYRTWHNMASNEVVKFRNKYAHGATPTEEECLQDIQNNLDNLNKSLSLSWLHDTSVIVFSEDLQSLEVGAEWGDIAMLQLDKKPEPHIPYVVLPNNSLLRLFPIVTYQPITSENKQSISFFNDLKGIQKNEISYLNYPYAEHIRDKVIYEQFIEVFRLEEWRKNLLNEFEDLMLRLQESFKGRTDELAYLQTFVERNNRGFLYLYGIPGIGKSALVANAFQEPNEKRTVIKYFVRNRRYTHVTEVLDYLNRTMDQMYRQQIQLPLGLGDTEEEKRKLLHERLQHVTPHLVSNGEKLIIMIDGLDEGDQALLNNLIFETYANVLVIYVARRTPEVTGFINDLPLDYLTKKEIGKIRSEDIRAMLYEVVNKYNITESYVQTIAEKSNGHPLYVRLLCDALVESPGKLNDEHYLPEKWEEFYKRFIDRFIDDEHGQLVLEGLFVFAAAKDYLSKDQMRLILHNNAQQNLIIFNRLSELLIESLEQRQHYQLFHETFHEYIMDYYAFDVMDAEEKILNYCMRWDSLDRFGEPVMRYPLKHLASHLQDMNDLRKLEDLVHHETFVKKQLEVTGQFNASFVLLEAYRNVAYEHNNERSFIDALIQIVKLNGELRRMSSANGLNGTSTSLIEWKNNVQNLYFYSDEEKSRKIFIDLWNSLPSDHETIEQMLEEINKLLPSSSNIFDWSRYVPLPLLIELSIQLYERDIQINTIVDRVKVDKDELERTLTHLLLREKSVHVVNLFIDRVQLTMYDSDVELLYMLIKQLFVSNLHHMVKFYEKKLLSQLKKSTHQFYVENVRRQLALSYLEEDLVHEAFAIINDTSYGPFKQAAYREIYETYKSTNNEIARKASEYGIEYLQQYTYDDRLKVLAEWLPLIYEEGATRLYEMFLAEIEKSFVDKHDSETFMYVEHVVEHYWTTKQFDRVLRLIEVIEDVEKLNYPLIIRLHSLSEKESTTVPAYVGEKVKQLYNMMETNILSNRLYNKSTYINELSYIVEQWVLHGRSHEAENIVDNIIDVASREQLILHLLDVYLTIDNRVAIVETAHKLKEFEKSAIDWMFEHQLTEELTMFLANIPSEKKRENLYSYSAIEALKRGHTNLFASYKKHVHTVRNRERITFEHIFFHAHNASYDEAVQLMMDSYDNKSITGNMQDDINIARAQRLLNGGNITEAYELLRTIKGTVSRSKMVEQAIDFHLHRHQFTEAIALFNDKLASPSFIKEPGSYKDDSHAAVNSLTNIIIEMSKVGDGRVVELLETYFEKTSLYPDTLSIHFMAITLLERNGTKQFTEQIVDICENLIQTYSVEKTGMMIALYPTVANQCDLSYFYYNNGQKIKARHHLQHVIQLFSENINGDQVNLMLSYMRIAYECKRQWMTEEFNYFSAKYKQLYRPNYKQSVWMKMVQLYIQDGNIAKALEAIEKLPSYREEGYVNIINHLLMEGKLTKALDVFETFKRKTKANVDNETYVRKAKKLLLQYYIKEAGVEMALQKIQSDQRDDDRFELYKQLLQTVTGENLSIFLRYIAEETSDMKHRLEQEIVMYALTVPSFTTKQLRHIFVNLSTRQAITVRSLYVYRTFNRYKYGETIDDSLVEVIDDVLHIQ